MIVDHLHTSRRPTLVEAQWELDRPGVFRLYSLGWWGFLGYMLAHFSGIVLWEIDIMSFGFPCQPFSSAGKKRGVEDERHLFPYLAEGIRVMQPRIVFAENVLGILSC